MRFILLMCVFLLYGCSTVANIEAMNDVGLEDTRRVFDAADKTRSVLGGKAEKNRAPVINRGYGHSQNMKTYPRSIEDAPYVTGGYKEMERYLRGIYCNLHQC